MMEAKSRETVGLRQGGMKSTSRRRFLNHIGSGAVTMAALTATGQTQGLIPPSVASAGADLAESVTRAAQAYRIREQAARRELLSPAADHPDNGDEARYPEKIGSYSKGLPHNRLGEVDLQAYRSLVAALNSGKSLDFENIIMGGGTKLTNPQAGLAFEMEGPDSHALIQRPAPAFSSAEEASEIAENYWMAMSRDIPFADYETSPLVQDAARDLSRFSDFKGPKAGGQVTSKNLFRGNTPGDLAGPYISQFLWMDTPFGAERVDRKMTTTLPQLDYMTSYDTWLAVQNGAAAGAGSFDTVPHYIRNGRDLAQWVHIDVLFQAYFNAFLILSQMHAALDLGNPYNESRTQIGFGTLGSPYMASVLCAIARPALKAVWYQKWFVHRRLRPEVFAGRIHNHFTGAKRYPIHSDILNSPVLPLLSRKYGTVLLPMAFPEGSPTHPSYGAGHATVAGACVTVLKAFFDESFVIPSPVEASSDGLSIRPYSGPSLTVGGELNKLAANVAFGRNIAGVHWRSDAMESLKLGEEVAIRYLREEHSCLNERYQGISLTRFDGTTVTI
jgi:membrane-associated phospholipid phosphatase